MINSIHQSFSHSFICMFIKWFNRCMPVSFYPSNPIRSSQSLYQSVIWSSQRVRQSRHLRAKSWLDDLTDLTWPTSADDRQPLTTAYRTNPHDPVIQQNSHRNRTVLNRKCTGKSSVSSNIPLPTAYATTKNKIPMTVTLCWLEWAFFSRRPWHRTWQTMTATRPTRVTPTRRHMTHFLWHGPDGITPLHMQMCRLRPARGTICHIFMPAVCYPSRGSVFW